MQRKLLCLVAKYEIIYRHFSFQPPKVLPRVWADIPWRRDCWVRQYRHWRVLAFKCTSSTTVLLWLRITRFQVMKFHAFEGQLRLDLKKGDDYSIDIQEWIGNIDRKRPLSLIDGFWAGCCKWKINEDQIPVVHIKNYRREEDSGGNIQQQKRSNEDWSINRWVSLGLCLRYISCDKFKVGVRYG